MEAVSFFADQLCQLPPQSLPMLLQSGKALHQLAVGFEYRLQLLPVDVVAAPLLPGHHAHGAVL